MSFRNYHIDARLDGSSLSQAIKALVPNTSWSAAKKLVANRHVQVHGNLCLDEGRRLKLGDVIKVWDDSLAKLPEASELTIVYRDNHLIVIDKPAGITTQREARETAEGRNQKQATLDELVQQALVRLPRIEPEKRAVVEQPKKQTADFIMKRRAPVERGSNKVAPVKVRPVHRLDRDTSGLIMFAFSPEAESKLSSLFKDHKIQRLYRAIVLGNFREALRIDSYFIRDRGDGLRGSSTDANARERQQAITHVKPIEHLGDDYTMVECRLETGRTHQIRIHLAERGHMLCGEKLYTRPLGGKPVRDPSDAPRHALHSATLAFDHPITGKPMRFQSDWPRDLARWIDRLGIAPTAD